MCTTILIHFMFKSERERENNWAARRLHNAVGNHNSQNEIIGSDTAANRHSICNKNENKKKLIIAAKYRIQLFTWTTIASHGSFGHITCIESKRKMRIRIPPLERSPTFDFKICCNPFGRQFGSPFRMYSSVPSNWRTQRKQKYRVSLFIENLLGCTQRPASTVTRMRATIKKRNSKNSSDCTHRLAYSSDREMQNPKQNIPLTIPCDRRRHDVASSSAWK